jgi:hypothetical protein
MAVKAAGRTKLLRQLLPAETRLSMETSKRTPACEHSAESRAWASEPSPAETTSFCSATTTSQRAIGRCSVRRSPSHAQIPRARLTRRELNQAAPRRQEDAPLRSARAHGRLSSTRQRHLAPPSPRVVSAWTAPRRSPVRVRLEPSGTHCQECLAGGHRSFAASMPSRPHDPLAGWVSQSGSYARVASRLTQMSRSVSRSASCSWPSL